MKTNYIFRLDDIAPNMNWDMMNKVKKLFNNHNVKPILGVIPKNEDEELKKYPLCNFNFWEEIRKYKAEGWEVAMHGYEHLYDFKCKKIDYLGLGGSTEFVGHPYETQLKKIDKGLNILKQQNLDTKIFFAPNHTFDQNTIKACKVLGFESFIDGYGIAPYYENQILFVPQLFYKLYTLPMGVQTFQIHINYFSDSDYIKLENFVKKNEEKIISYKEVGKLASNTILDKLIRLLLKKTLQIKRSIF